MSDFTIEDFARVARVRTLEASGSTAAEAILNVWEADKARAERMAAVVAKITPDEDES